MSVWDKYPQALRISLDMLYKGESNSYITKYLQTFFREPAFTYYAVRNKLTRHIASKTVIDPSTEISLLVSDLHEPFTLPHLDNVVEEYKGKAKRVIVLGDALDEFAVSKYAKDKEVALKDEMIRLHTRLSKWSEWFEEIVLINGNHDDRIDKYVNDKLSPTVLFLIKPNLALRHFSTGFSYEDADGVEHSFPGIKNVKAVGNWFYQQGDAILAHPSDFYSTEGKTVVKTDEFFLAQGFNHRATIIGHTHKTARFTPGGARLQMEIGCTCKPMAYALKGGKIKYRPQTNAIGILVQRNGITDVNECNYFVI